MGAKKWRPEYFGFLKDQHVVIVPDDDKDGAEHAQQVVSSLRGIAPSIRVLELPGLEERGDVSDWLDRGGTVDKLMELARKAPEWEPPETQEAPQGVLRFQSAADIARETPQDIQWIVPPFVPSEALVKNDR